MIATRATEPKLGPTMSGINAWAAAATAVNLASGAGSRPKATAHNVESFAAIVRP